MATEVDIVDVSGLRIAYRREGAGSPLVLLHGGASDSREWRRQLEALSDEFTVVAWDAPGCGRSSDPPESFRLPDYADCLHGFIDALGLGRPHVLGLSFGGGLALELYRRHPMVATTLVLASAYPGWAGSFPEDIVQQRLQECLRESDMPAAEWVPAWIPGLLTETAPAELVDEVVAIMSDFHPVGYRAMAHAFAEADLRDVLPHIAVPTLLLFGELDQRAPMSLAEYLRAEIPDSTLVVVPGVGHQLNLEAPHAFNDEVRRFLGAADS